MFSEEINKVSMAAQGKINLLKKSKLRYLLASALAGLYVGLGIMLIFTIGGVLNSAHSPATKIVMGISFGVALSLVIFAGAELFTGNNFVMTVGFLKKTVSLGDLLSVWIFSFLGNVAGSVFGAWLYYSTGLATGPVGKFITTTVSAKMNGSVHELFAKGVLCNILVCLAVWCSFKMKEEIGKLVMTFWCLFVFITAGFEHSVANMTLLAIGLFIPHPANVTVIGYIYNIGIVSLGNVVGGAIVLALPYFLISKDK
ncbi:formate/nitrite transporter family protein [Inconstantimicrobium mannanitabidum]|uniref:Transporter n=1 Tax=Inconstantimicrobium mannanitabidum TaxID=1604901 RepID=A0ACB5RFX4_9CLOT|nr:formate/nitrite transporter family protein [Clostridium sp. TW13]GKX67995.1 transporter [Clostridium sp. TW13]